MGLKTKDYKVDKYDIVLPEAYARLVRVSIDIQGDASGMFEINKTRKDMLTKESFEVKYVSCKIDKNLPIYEQLYNKAKETKFAGWEDDIVDEVE